MLSPQFLKITANYIDRSEKENFTVRFLLIKSA